ncbi:MAG: hypothetical protein OJF47_002049 [Nitrospira sp.]|nr:MAG: hypothetical protein OJF47_002049 [Nitrospira sp.]
MTTDKKPSEIATAGEFGDQFAFSHCFKRVTGHSPMAFRIQRRRRLSAMSEQVIIAIGVKEHDTGR